MKKVLSAIVVSGLVFTGTTCFAANGLYLKGIAKYVAPSDPEIAGVNLNNDNGLGLGGAVGWALDHFRIEGEISTQKSDLDAVGTIDSNTNIGIANGEVRMTTYLVNGYFDIPISDLFGLYLTAGLGYGTTDISLSDNLDGDDSGFAWKGGLGMSFAFNDNMAMDLGWEYLSMNDADLDVTVSGLYTNNIVAAFRYTF